MNFPSTISTFKPTLVSASFSSLSAIFLVVIYFPSFPANGLSFTKNSILKVGSSIAIVGNASNSPTPIVSPTKIFGIPLIVTISQHSAWGISILWSPSVLKICAIFPLLFSPSFPIMVTWLPALKVPWYTRPTPSLPK